jgi:hypothetical protein
MSCLWMIWGDCGRPIVVHIVSQTSGGGVTKTQGTAPYTQLTAGPRNELQA